MLGLVAGRHVSQQLVAGGLVQASGAHLQHLKGEGGVVGVGEEEMEGLDMSHDYMRELLTSIVRGSSEDVFWIPYGL